MMHPDKVAAILINDLDSMVHYIEALPAHPSYTSALDHVQRAKVALSTGRTDLHQRGMASRFKTAGPTDQKVVADTSSCGDGLSDQHEQRRVPRFADGGLVHTDAPWLVNDASYFVRYNVPADLVDLFWKRVNPEGPFTLCEYVESRVLPKVLQVCYTLDGNQHKWTLDIRKCPAHCRNLYPNLALEYSTKEWDKGAVRETWQRGLYYWHEDQNKYVLRHAALAWHNMGAE